MPEVLDVITAPGTARRGRAGARRPGVDHHRGPGRRRPRRGAGAFRRRPGPLSYLYTSGTTSFPKGVVGTHLAIYLESMSGALDSGWNSADRFAAMMPMFHTAQLNAFCTPAILVGATIYVLRGFDPATLLELIEREQITQVFGLPMMYRAMLDHETFKDRGLSSLRRAVYAMAPMPDDLIRRCLDGFGCDFALLFGQTEMSPITTLFRPEHQLSHVGAVGTPLIGVQVAIMGPSGDLLPPGRAGRDRLPGAEHHVRVPLRSGGHRCRVRARLVPLRRRRAISATTACCGSPTATRT